ncbi:MAG: HXXEE domain-containing protein [Acidobacteria bacterium]|nr:HXXEE domain-containing protein [Acidobacteriota bacterium]
MTFRRKPRYAVAWVALTLALAVHVFDEALHDFLAFYNPIAMSLRDVMLWTWMPTFEFGVWLGGLICVLAALLSMSCLAFYGARWMVWAALPYGLLMCGNGALHLAASWYLRKLVPGVWSAPLLLVCGGWLLVEAVREWRAQRLNGA